MLEGFLCILILKVIDLNWVDS